MKVIIKTIMPLILCFVLTACVPLWTNQTNAPAITGKVIDNATGEPIDNAEIEYKTNHYPKIRTGVTNLGGVFKIDKINYFSMRIILPFFGVQIPTTNYQMSETEQPVCYIRVRKKGYKAYSTILKSVFLDGRRRLSFLECKNLQNENLNYSKIFYKKYHNTILLNDNQLFLYLEPVTETTINKK